MPRLTQSHPALDVAQSDGFCHIMEREREQHVWGYEIQEQHSAQAVPRASSISPLFPPLFTYQMKDSNVQRGPFHAKVLIQRSVSIIVSTSGIFIKHGVIHHEISRINGKKSKSG
jgi:hypothetical protein